MRQWYKILYGKNGMKSKNEILNLIQQNIQNSSDLLYYSSVITEFNRAMSSPDVQIEKLSNIIEKDPGLTANVLRMANSSYYGLSKRVMTVKHAVSLLGYVSLEKIFTVNVFSKSISKQRTAHGENLWKHSLAVAIAAQQIVSNIKPEMSELAFTAGLLHDIGKFLIMNLLPDSYNNLLKEFNKNPYQYSIGLDNKFIGIDHQQVGELFAKSWDLPQPIINVIRYHHNIDFAKDNKDIVAAVSVANNIVKGMELGQSTSMLVELIPKWVWSYISLNKEDFYKIIPLIQQKYNAYLAFLNIV